MDSLENKLLIANKVALHIKEIRGFRYEKWLNLVMQSSWWNSTTIPCSQLQDIERIATLVNQEIEQGIIL